MKLATLLRAAEMLRTQPACTMPLRDLHARLRAELGGAAGSYRDLYHGLKQRPDSFVLFDAPRLLDADIGWPAEIRERYHHAFADAGLGSCVRVALTEHVDDASAEPLALAGNTLGQLWRCCRDDATMRACLVQAARQLERIMARIQEDAAAARPTTPAPGPSRAS